MSHLGVLAGAAAAVAACLSGTTIAPIRRPLHIVLWELCVFEERARFWERTCWLALAIGIALTGSFGLSAAGESADLTAAVAIVLRFEVAGTVFSIAVIGLVVLREARRIERQGPPSCARLIDP